MNSLLKTTIRPAVINQLRVISSQLGDLGCGVGKGGGGGGSIREAGGGLGKVGTAVEEDYFYRKQKDQLQKLKSDIASEEQDKSQEEIADKKKKPLTEKE